MTKQDIRAKLLDRRQKCTPEEAEKAGRYIAARLEGAVDWSRVDSVHVYRSLPALGEISTKPIVRWLKQMHPEVFVCVGDVVPDAPFPERQFDVIFTPVLGFDRGGFRLGLGGGWYDRWLATQVKSFKIGLAYAWAEVENLPHESHDIPLDKLITDKTVIEISATAPSGRMSKNRYA